MFFKNTFRKKEIFFDNTDDGKTNKILQTIANHSYLEESSFKIKKSKGFKRKEKMQDFITACLHCRNVKSS